MNTNICHRLMQDKRGRPWARIGLPATGLILLLLTGTGALDQSSIAEAGTTDTWIRQYGEVLDGVQYNVAPRDVQAALEGGYIALGSSVTSTGHMSWLVKLDSLGAPLWQREIGVPHLPPGSYSIGVSVQQTTDEGYIIGGGTRGGGSGDDCPFLSGIECVWVTKVDSEGEIVWSRASRVGSGGSAIRQIRNTQDGGFIAVGYAGPGSSSYGALLIKFDNLGAVEWQRVLGPDGTINAYFNSVQQTSDGGYVAVGEFYRPRSGLPPTSVLVVKFDSAGSVEWQSGYNNLDNAGIPIGMQQAHSIIQTPDDGYLVAGGWSNPVPPLASNALLLKLDSNGNIEWQTAYDGGQYCYSGFGRHCARIGGVIRSIGQTVDGGYVLAGFSRQIFRDSVPIEPWMARTDSSGRLIWQYLYYPILPRTGRPLGEDFVAVTLANDGGFLAVGWSEIYDLQRSDLYVVKTDEAGLVGACGEVWDAPRLSAIDPAMTVIFSALPVDDNLRPGIESPSVSLSTSSVSALQNCGSTPSF